MTKVMMPEPVARVRVGSIIEYEHIDARGIDRGAHNLVTTTQAEAYKDACVREAQTWRPIETAPKDGNCLVAVDTDYGWWIGSLERDKYGNWIHEGEPTYCRDYMFQPKHWMPLPPPPRHPT